MSQLETAAESGFGRWMSIVLGVCLFSTMGCNRISSTASLDEVHNPHFQKAKRLMEERDFKGAAESYEKALELTPRLAAAHFELGLLSDEKLGDPIAAVYHYNRYLALRPNTDKRQLVEDFIQRAKLTIASKLPQSPIVDPSDLSRLQNEKAAVLQDNAALRNRVAELEKAAAATQPAAPALPVAVTPPAAPPIRVANQPDTGASTPVIPPSPPSSTGEAVKSRLHSVQKGDTLYSLALKYYGTRSAWQKIYDANRTMVASKDILKVGQQLVIP